MGRRRSNPADRVLMGQAPGSNPPGSNHCARRGDDLETAGPSAAGALFLIDKISDATLLAGAALVIPSIAMIAPLGIAPLLAVLLATLALWGALSASWSIIPAHSLFEAARFLLLAIAGLVIAAAALAVD